jgi:hypothetical protein
MSRLVEVQIAREGVEAPPPIGEQVKQHAERAAKYVPGEILGFYMGAVQLIQLHASATFRVWTFAIVGLFAWIFTPIWLGRFAEHPASKRPNQVMGFIAFGIWAYAYPAGFFFELGWHEPVIAGLALLFFTLLSSFYQPRAAG